MDDDDTTPARRYSTFPDGEHRDGGGTEEAGAPVVSRRRGARPRDGLPGHPLPPPSPAPLDPRLAAPQSQTNMMSLLRPGTQAKYVRLAEEHDDLGWTNFIEGRISRKFFEIKLQFYVKKRFRKSAGKWASGLIEILIGLIHSQWLYRNSQIHYASHYGGETRREYDEIMRTISHLVADTDPEDLLPEDRI
ncbi:hypothetical protein THAOC_14557 [Thalassiosira oceanica]|uniref:Uncharacterized protein n=1 Tax=Thalassiosira oceanica TaxID=159749 RepID=K0SID3_THAOC|nr:hypothetical protein THAOC_14557 [Thalassiosira oceanica]|eukprot:EJK64684.1 hypothetical protein THAOC_14557 [Thalassiosira oceanica]